MKSQYKKLSLLGEGSHAKVHLVEDENGRQFALKEFLLGSDEEYDEMFEREEKANKKKSAGLIFKVRTESFSED